MVIKGAFDINKLYLIENHYTINESTYDVRCNIGYEGYELEYTYEEGDGFDEKGADWYFTYEGEVYSFF